MTEAAAAHGERAVNRFIFVKPRDTHGASSADSNSSAFSREAAVSTVKTSGILQFIETSGILQLPAVYWN